MECVNHPQRKFSLACKKANSVGKKYSSSAMGRKIESYLFWHFGYAQAVPLASLAFSWSMATAVTR